MKTFLLSLLVALSLTNCSHISTPPVVESTRAVASEDCNEVVTTFFVKEKGAQLVVQKGSIFDRYPHIYEMMDSLSLMEINYSQFYKDFMNEHHKAPTLRDALIYSFTVTEKTLKNYETVILELNNLAKVENSDALLFAQSLASSKSKLSHFKNLNQIAAELEASFKNNKTHIPNIDVVIPLDKNNPEFIDEDYWQFLKNRISLSGFQGEYGEQLAYGASPDKVLGRGLQFKRNLNDARTPTEKLIATRIIELQKKLDVMTDKEIIAFIEPHKEGLFRMAYAALLEHNSTMKNRSEVIEKMMSMIKSKEIDLIEQDANGKVIWSEVKAYVKPISAKTITHGKDKTILDQLIEHRALRDVLGLKDDVRMRFVSPLTVTEDSARKLIEEAGYEVISAK